MKILITGAAGSVGTVLTKGLRERHALRGFDRQPMPELEDTVVGNIGDFDTVLRAAKGMEGIVHLATYMGNGDDWEDFSTSTLHGTYHVFEAARRQGVKRVAFASTIGFDWPGMEPGFRTPDMPMHPSFFYRLGKLYGQQLGYMYAHKHGLEVVCVRIGGFEPELKRPTGHAELGSLDTVRVFERAMIHPGVHYEVIFGVSAQAGVGFDLEPGRNGIGYEPADLSEYPDE